MYGGRRSSAAQLYRCMWCFSACLGKAIWQPQEQRYPVLPEYVMFLCLPGKTTVPARAALPSPSCQCVWCFSLCLLSCHGDLFFFLGSWVISATLLRFLTAQESFTRAVRSTEGLDSQSGIHTRLGDRIGWCFEPRQSQRIISGLKTNITLSPRYSDHK